MNAIEYWAIQDGLGSTSIGDFGSITEETLESVRKCAFIRGFKAAKEKAASIATSFHECPSAQSVGLSILIRAIGTAQVDENGKSIAG